MSRPPIPHTRTQTDHLRQLWLFRTHITEVLSCQPSDTRLALSLLQLRRAVDRYQSMHTGDVSHFESTSNDLAWSPEAAND